VEPFTPMPLERVREPFDHPAFVYENKWDGFRALPSQSSPAERSFHATAIRFGRFAPLASASAPCSACAMPSSMARWCAWMATVGRRFRELLFYRALPSFVAFDLLALKGRDVRRLPLLERKRLLRRVIPKRRDTVLYYDHVAGRGRQLFAIVCANDLEGIVAKLATAPCALIDGRRWRRWSR
jgi:bifunctional non-homologous end joining protein LigD